LAVFGKRSVNTAESCAMDALEEIATLRAALAEREAELVTAGGINRRAFAHRAI
jgi:hypothetical protein